MQRTKIEYLSHTWNPLAMRCTPVSAGCDNCWHLRMANRLAHIPSISEREQLAYAPKDQFADHEQLPILRSRELSAPLRLRKPTRIGVQFMGDIMHESVTNEQIAAVFGVMAACPQHTFLILTKRSERMAEWFEWWDGKDPIDPCATEACKIVPELNHYFDRCGVEIFPLPNLWLGASVEDQKTYDERWPHVERTPATVRYISYEPALGGLYLCLKRWEPDLVICGSETGPGKRPMNLNWARDLRDQCVAADVPFFFKVDSNGNHELDGRTWEEMP